jgi:hypothetical protein
MASGSSSSAASEEARLAVLAVESACNRGALRAILDVMRQRPSCLATQRASCLAVLGAIGSYNLEQSSEGCAALFAEGRAATDAVVDAMRAHAEDALLQGTGAEVLEALMECDAGFMGCAVNAGAARGLLAALRTHVAVAAVVVAAAVALNRIVVRFNTLTEPLADDVHADMVNAALGAARLHAACTAPLSACLHLLAVLCITRQQVSVAGAAGAIGVIAWALRTHAANADVAEMACFALGHASLQATAVQRRDAHVLETLMALLQKRAPVVKVLNQALFAIGATVAQLGCATDEDAQHAVRLGAIEAIVNAMRAHASNAQVQAASLYALHAITMWDGRHGVAAVARAVRAGALPLVQSALRMYGEKPEFARAREEAEQLQAVMQASDADARNAADAAMAALLAEEKAERSAAQQPKKGGAGANKGAKAKQKRKKNARQTDTGHAGAAPPPAGAADAAAFAVDDEEEDAAATTVAATTVAVAAADEVGDAAAHHAADAPDAAQVHNGADAATAPPHEAGAASSLADDAIFSGAMQQVALPPPLPAAPTAAMHRTAAPRAYEPPVGGASPMTAAAEQDAGSGGGDDGAEDDSLLLLQHLAQSAMPTSAGDAAQLPAALASLALGAAQQQEETPPPPIAPPVVPPAPPLPVQPPPAPPAPPAPPIIMKIMKECCICLDDVQLSEMHALLPCMHRCVCAACADMLLAEARPCPKCRESVARAARVFED